MPFWRAFSPAGQYCIAGASSAYLTIEFSSPRPAGFFLGGVGVKPQMGADERRCFLGGVDAEMGAMVWGCWYNVCIRVEGVRSL